MHFIKSYINRIKKSTIIKGTLILTIAGFLTRIIGFLFRIFLNNKIGAEGLGIYQLIFPMIWARPSRPKPSADGSHLPVVSPEALLYQIHTDPVEH